MRSRRNGHAANRWLTKFTLLALLALPVAAMSQDFWTVCAHHAWLSTHFF
jgi:hypothetical protein